MALHEKCPGMPRIRRTVTSATPRTSRGTSHTPRYLLYRYLGTWSYTLKYNNNAVVELNDHCATFSSLSVVCRTLTEMESFQFVSSMRSYVTSARTKAPFKQSGTQQAGRGKCREGGEVSRIHSWWDTWVRAIFHLSTTLSPVVFV